MQRDPVWHRQLDRVAEEIGWHDPPYRTAPGPGGRQIDGDPARQVDAPVTRLGRHGLAGTRRTTARG